MSIIKHKRANYKGCHLQHICQFLYVCMCVHIMCIYITRRGSGSVLSKMFEYNLRNWIRLGQFCFMLREPKAKSNSNFVK